MEIQLKGGIIVGREYHGAGSGAKKAAYRDEAIRCNRGDIKRVYELVKKYPGISSGAANKVIGTAGDVYIHVRLTNGVGSSNWEPLKRDLRNKVGIII